MMSPAAEKENELQVHRGNILNVLFMVVPSKFSRPPKAVSFSRKSNSVKLAILAVSIGEAHTEPLRCSNCAKMSACVSRKTGTPQKMINLIIVYTER